MTTFFWIKSTAGAWDDSANWSLSSGGAGGAGVPTTGDDAIFDGNGTGNCNVSASFYKCDLLDLRSGYTGKVHGGTVARGFDILAELKIASGATVEATGSFIFQLANGGTISLLDGSLTGDGRFIAQGGTTYPAAASTIDINRFDVGSSTPGGGFTSTFVGDLTFNGDVNFVYSKSFDNHTVDLSTNNPSLTFKGNVSFGGSNPERIIWNKGTGAITFGGSANQSVDFNGEAVEDIDIDKTAGTVTLTGNVDTDSLTGTAGALDINSNTLDSTGNVTIAAGFAVSDTGQAGTIVCGGNFALNGADGNGITWTDADLTITGTATASFSTVSGSDASGGTEVDASDGTNTDNGGNVNWDFGAPAAGGPFRSRTKARLKLGL